MIINTTPIKRSGIFCLILGLLLSNSCVKDKYTGPDPTLPKRTVLVYLGGDNVTLSSTLVKEVEALRKGWTYTGNRCLIYIDPFDDVPRLLSLRGGCQIHPTPFIDTIAVYPEENSASAAVFKRVMDNVVTLYPADSYGLIFCSHASGWMPKGSLAYPTRSIGSDINTESASEAIGEIELADFAEVIPDGRFDFIIFEACLMSGVEVAYALRNKTNYILASSAELLTPGFVPIFPGMLSTLFNMTQSPEADLLAFAMAYYSYINGQSGVARSATLSLIATKSIDDLASRAREVFAAHASQSTTVDLASIQHFDRPGSYGDTPALPRYFDFLDYMKKIVTTEQYTAIVAAVNNVVVWKAATPTFMMGYNGFEIINHSGLTLYIEQPEFEKLNTAYHETAWWQATQKF